MEEISNSGACQACLQYSCGVFLGGKIYVLRLTDNLPLLSNTDRTCSKDSIQGTKGLVRVSESPRFGVWRGRCSEWGTADTSGVVDGQANGGGRTVVAPLESMLPWIWYRTTVRTCNKITLTIENGGDNYRLSGQIHGKARRTLERRFRRV